MKKLYTLLIKKTHYGYPVLLQVSFNKDELEEIVKSLNQYKHFPANAYVEEVNEYMIEHYFPEKNHF